MATVAMMQTLEGRQVARRERLDRAADSLDVQDMGAGLYRVTGGREPHFVRPADDSGNQCDCGDYLWRTLGTCKHLMAVGLYQSGGDVDAVLSHAGAREVV